MDKMTFLQSGQSPYVPSENKAISILDIQTKYINIAADREKNKNMQKILTNFSNHDRLEATVLPNTILALAYSHYRALSSMEAPCIILEDDCIWYEFRDTVEIPSDADILFLGIFKDVPKPFKSGKFVPAFEKISPDLARVYSMLGSHAIMYVSDRGRDAALKAYEMAIRTEAWNDVVLSRTLPFLNAYALIKPLFAQTSMYDQSYGELGQSVGEDVLLTVPGDF